MAYPFAKLLGSGRERAVPPPQQRLEVVRGKRRQLGLRECWIASCRPGRNCTDPRDLRSHVNQDREAVGTGRRSHVRQVHRQTEPRIPSCLVRDPAWDHD